MTLIYHQTSGADSRFTARFYEAVGLSAPRDGRLRVEVSELPRLRGRLVAAGAAVREESPSALCFRDPSGTVVRLTGESRPAAGGTMPP